MIIRAVLTPRQGLARNKVEILTYRLRVTQVNKYKDTTPKRTSAILPVQDILCRILG